MILVDAVGIFKEKVTAVKHGQPVMFCSGDQLTAFTQFNDAADTGEDHLMHVKGLRDEIRSAHLQRFELCAFFGSQDDDRDRLQLLVIAEDVQHRKPVHDRHHQVQQDDGEAVRILSDDFQRFLPVFSIQNFIIVFQDHAQNITVELLIVNYQNVLRFFDLF